GLLLQLARQFRRPVEYFLSASLESRPGYYVQRGSEIEQLPIHYRKPRVEGKASRNGGVFRPLAAGFPTRGLHPYYVKVKANAEETLAPHDHQGQEFIYVLDGEVELMTQAGGEEIVQVLRPGDCVFLESSAPHRLRGRSQNPFAETSAEMLE